MSSRRRFGAALASGLLLVCSSVAQEPPSAGAPPPSPTPAASAAPATGPAPMRLADKPMIRVDRLSSENPFGLVAETPPALPAKPVFTEQVVETSLFATMHVDKTGKVVGVQRPRDPIPSLAAETKRSFDRWSFDPARKGGQPVETWATVRVEMAVTVRPPKIEQLSLNPILPSTAIPTPLEWGSDQAWYDSAPASAPAGAGIVAIEQADTIAVPKKTRWDADSYKGPFAIRMWVKIDPNGHVERAIPIQASDPVLIPYFRKQVSAWQLRPAAVKGKPVESWAELSAVGQISWSAEVKQVGNLRKSIGGT